MQGCHRSETVRIPQDKLEIWRSMPSTTLWSLRKPSRSISREQRRPKTVLSSRNASIFCFDNNVDTLLISELSRLGRNVDDVLANVQLCKEHHLNVYFQKEQLSIFNADGKEHPFLTIFVAVLGTCAEMERENIKFRLNSGKEKYIAEGGKVGRKEGYRKSEEKLQEEYASVIKQLKKGYPIRMIAKNEGVGISTVQRMKKKFVDVA